MTQGKINFVLTTGPISGWAPFSRRSEAPTAISAGPGPLVWERSINLNWKPVILIQTGSNRMHSA